MMTGTSTAEVTSTAQVTGTSTAEPTRSATAEVTETAEATGTSTAEPTRSATAVGTSTGTPAPTGTAVSEGRTAICHRTGNGGYHQITVSNDALDAHRAHGDIVPAPAGGCPAR